MAGRPAGLRRPAGPTALRHYPHSRAGRRGTGRLRGVRPARPPQPRSARPPLPRAPRRPREAPGQGAAARGGAHPHHHRPGRRAGLAGRAQHLRDRRRGRQTRRPPVPARGARLAETPRQAHRRSRHRRRPRPRSHPAGAAARPPRPARKPAGGRPHHGPYPGHRRRGRRGPATARGGGASVARAAAAIGVGPRPCRAAGLHPGAARGGGRTRRRPRRRRPALAPPRTVRPAAPRPTSHRPHPHHRGPPTAAGTAAATPQPRPDHGVPAGRARQVS